MTSDHPGQFARWVRRLTTVGVIGLIITLLLPAIQRAREAARRVCTKSEAKKYQFPGEFLRSETLVSESAYQVIAHINRAGETKVIEYAEISSKDPGKPMDVSLDGTVQRFCDRTTIEVIDADQFLSDAALCEFALLSNLEWLSVGGKHITDAGTKHLAAIPSLRTLTLDQTEVTAAGLEQLRAAPKLTSLTILEPSFGDDGIQVLARWDGLTRLRLEWYIRPVQVTAKGLAKLVEQRPELQVTARYNGRLLDNDGIRLQSQGQHDAAELLHDAPADAERPVNLEPLTIPQS